MDLVALALTLRLATATTAILAVVGLPLAYWLASGRTAAGGSGPLRMVVEATCALPLVLPPTVLGFYLLRFGGPQGALGHVTEALTGGRLPFTFAGILMGSVLYNLPFAVRPFTAAIAAVDRRLLEASWCLGVSRSRTALRSWFA